MHPDYKNLMRKKKAEIANNNFQNATMEFNKMRIYAKRENSLLKNTLFI